MKPIVSSIGTIMYYCAKHLASIISPIAGKSQRHIKNSKQFSKLIKNCTVEDRQALKSYVIL